MENLQCYGEQDTVETAVYACVTHAQPRGLQR